jgi:hypothetical protein
LRLHKGEEIACVRQKVEVIQAKHKQKQ